MKKRDQVIRATRQAVCEAVRLCNENARRLLRNARTLLDHGGSDGLAYVLWSLAVEEFGKGVLLERQLSGEAADCLEITQCSDHNPKFAAGFECLTELYGTGLGTFLRVTDNPTNAPSVVENPFRSESAVTVEGGQTGLFSDGLDDLAGVDPTVKLRFALIYVDWNPDENRWMRPGQTLRHGGLVARWELSRDDLLEALEALEKKVTGTKT